MNRLQEKYKNEVVPQLMKDFNYKSVMQVPKIEKVVVISVSEMRFKTQSCWMKPLKNWLQSQGRLQSSQRLRNPLPTLSCVKGCRSDVK